MLAPIFLTLLLQCSAAPIDLRKIFATCAISLTCYGNRFSNYSFGKRIVDGVKSLDHKFPTPLINDQIPSSQSRVISDEEASFKSFKIFKQLETNSKKLTSEIKSSVMERFNKVFQYDITSSEKSFQFYLDLRDQVGVYKGIAAKPDIVIKVSDEDLDGLSNGSLSGFNLFVSGRIKLSGNIWLIKDLDSATNVFSKKS